MNVRLTNPGAQPRTESVVVRRFDRAALPDPARTAEGWVRLQGTLTRAGVFDYYVKPDAGRPEMIRIREFRPPAEVFDVASVRSFALVPLCLGHPSENLTPATVRMYQRGTVGEPRVSGDHLEAEILVTDLEAIQAIENGTTQLSCGYSARVDFAPGVYTDENGIEHPFDAIQREIRGNHVALVDLGRAGSAELRLDAGDGVIMDAGESRVAKGNEMPKVAIDGTEHEVTPEVLAYLTSLQAALKTASENAPKTDMLGEDKAKKDMDPGAGEGGPADELQALKGRLAVLEEALAMRDKKDAADRLAVVRQDAAKILGVDVPSLEASDLATIQARVVKHVLPSLAVGRQDSAYLEGAYQSALEIAKRTRPGAELAAGINAAKDASGQARHDSLEAKAEDAQARYAARLRNQWKSPAQLAAESAAK